MHQPTAYYILTGTRRCGSSLLCDRLEATGLAGMPQEFYSRWLLAHWVAQWNLPADYSAEMFFATTLRRTTPNGVHGVKLFYDHLFASPLTLLASQRGITPEAALHILYPGARYLHLSRRDLRGQALSYWRAKATDVWFASAPGQHLGPVRLGQPPLLTLNPMMVLQCEQEICQEEQAWAQFYHRHRLTPVRLLYEDLLADMPRQLAYVLQRLGLDPLAAYQVAPPRLQQQRDRLTEEWRTTMQAWAPERTNPFTVHPFWKPRRSGRGGKKGCPPPGQFLLPPSGNMVARRDSL